MQTQYKKQHLKPIGAVVEAIAKLTTGKQTIQFKESPQTSRVNTPTPSLSFVMKYDDLDEVGTSDTKQLIQHEDMTGIVPPRADMTTEDEEEQPRDLRFRSLNKIMSALQQASATDAARRAAMEAMIRGPVAVVSPGMPFHSITAVTSTATGTPAANVSPHLQPVHAHQPLLNFPPPSPPRGFASLLPVAHVEVTIPGGNTLVTVAAGTVVTTTNASNTNSSISITPTTNVSMAGSSSGGSTWGGAYTCDRCGNSYARPHSLNRHVRFECGVEPKFECPICHKKSKHKHNLVLHMRTHQHR